MNEADSVPIAASTFVGEVCTRRGDLVYRRAEGIAAAASVVVPADLSDRSHSWNSQPSFPTARTPRIAGWWAALGLLGESVNLLKDRGGGHECYFRVRSAL